jgi:putative ATP-dependent endonuclease of OLD family
MTDAATTLPAFIRRLKIQRFRGIEDITWYPTQGVNVILGGGDVGKTTILDACALLLHPTNTTTLSDADYWLRDASKGFEIEAVIHLPESSGISEQNQHVWPWLWDGKEPLLPKEEEEGSAPQESVYVVRVRGTEEFDLVYEVLQPNGDTSHFSATTRRAIGLVRLGGDDKNDRDLRLVQGSALDRLLSDPTLRARLGKALDETKVEEKLQPDAKLKLNALDKAFDLKALPKTLGLGITAGQGISVSALIGLTAAKGSVQLPLMNWGAGTRRLAALEITASQQGETPITVVDEIERGLEPYRQRMLVSRLQGGQSQAFVTTHSAPALAAAASSSIWYLGSNGVIAQLPESVSKHRKNDPESFLSRISIVAEGKTEVGFVTALLEKTIGADFLEHGVWVTEGVGNESSLSLLEDLSKAGLVFGGLVDDEGLFPGRWATVKQRLGVMLLQWPAGCTEENILPLVPITDIEKLIEHPQAEKTGTRLRTLADRLGIGEDKSFANILANTADIKNLILEAATGKVPPGATDPKRFKSESACWFKSINGGKELLEKVFSLGLHTQLEPQLLPFVNAVRTAIDLPALTSLPHE